MHLTHSGQPDLVHQQPAAGHQRRRLPAARDRLERQRQRPAPDRLGDQPGRRQGDLRQPATRQGTDVSTFATSPLWKVVDGPFKLQSFNTTNSSYVLVPNKSYGLSPKPNVHVRCEHLHELDRAARRDEVRRRWRSATSIPARSCGAIPTLEARRIQRLRRSRLGLVRWVLQLQGHHRPLQQGPRAAVHPRRVRAADRRAGDRRRTSTTAGPCRPTARWQRRRSRRSSRPT